MGGVGRHMEEFALVKIPLDAVDDVVPFAVQDIEELLVGIMDVVGEGQARPDLGHAHVHHLVVALRIGDEIPRNLSPVGLLDVHPL